MSHDVSALTPSVAVVVVVHAFHRERVSRCLSSVTSSKGVEPTLVVAYNGSIEGRDGVVEAVAAHHGRLLLLPRNLGFAHAVNAAVQACPPQIPVMLLNDDAWLDPAALRTLVDTLAAADSTTIGAAPVVLRPDGRVDSYGLALTRGGEAHNAHVDLRREDVDASRALLGATFGAALVRRDAFDTVGFLDESLFMYYEDVEWCLRAAHRGLRWAGVPTALVHHEQGSTAARLGEARRFAILQRNALMVATSTLSWRGVAQVWRAALVRHAKGIITGPYRWSRVRAVTAAALQVPARIKRRRTSRGPTPLADDQLWRLGEDPAATAAT